MNFAIEKKGYKKDSVDSHIKQLSMQYDRASAEQRDRIFELKSALTTSERLIEEYRRKESEINSALVAAVNKAREMEDIAQKKYDLEIQRLKLFNAKWQSYFNEIIKRYPIDDNLVSVAMFTSEMANILSGGKGGKPVASAETEPPQPQKAVKTATPVKTPAPVTRASDAKAQYESEKKRLAEVEPDPMGAIKNYFDNQNKISNANKGTAAAMMKSESGFDINEALHPDQDLEDILAELGIKGE
jgi:hypothetical protein